MVTVKELRSLLRARGLPVSGVKSVLQARLSGVDPAALVTVTPPSLPRPFNPTPVGSSFPADPTPRPKVGAADALRVATWNVAGLRALLRSESGCASLRHLVTEANVDVLMLQETKLQEEHV